MKKSSTARPCSRQVTAATAIPQTTAAAAKRARSLLPAVTPPPSLRLVAAVLRPSPAPPLEHRRRVAGVHHLRREAVDLDDPAAVRGRRLLLLREQERPVAGGEAGRGA